MIQRICDLLSDKAALCLQKRPLRFLLTGILNSLFGLLVYSLAILLWKQVWLALLTAVCAGIVFNFATIGGFVFRDISIQRLPGFVSCYALIYVINYTLIEVFSIWIDSVILSQALLTPFIAIASYLLLARFVFQNPGYAGKHSS